MIERFYGPLELTRRVNSLTNYMPVTDYESVLFFEGVINMASPTEIETLGVIGSNISHKMYSELVTIQNGDRVVDQAGRKYDVIGVVKNTINRNHHAKVWLYEVRQ